MAHSDCGWTCGCAGKTVKFLENTCHIWTLLWWWFTTKRRYVNCMDLFTYTLCSKINETLWTYPSRKCRWQTNQFSGNISKPLHTIDCCCWWRRRFCFTRLFYRRSLQFRPGPLKVRMKRCCSFLPTSTLYIVHPSVLFIGLHRRAAFHLRRITCPNRLKLLCLMTKLTGSKWLLENSVVIN